MRLLKSPQRARPRPAPGRRPCLERLEGRDLPSAQHPIVAAFDFPQADIDRLTADVIPGEIAVLGDPSPASCSQMQQLQAAGIQVGGYVDTADGGRPLADVFHDIDRWFTFCPSNRPEWIFGDRGLLDRDPAHYAFYQQVRDYVHGHGAEFMLNEGGALAGAGEGVMALADTVLAYEDTAAGLGVPDCRTRTHHPPAWLGNYPPDRLAMTIHSTSVEDLPAAVARSQYLGFAGVYVYDGDPTSYGHLSPYWCLELEAIRSGDVTYPRPPVSTLTDSFAGTEINPCLWWSGAQGGATAREDGSLILSLPPGPGSQAFVRSQDLWSLAGSSAVVEAPEVVGPGASNKFVLVYSDEPGHESQLEFWYENGHLFLNYWLDGQLNNVATLPYSPADHRWWGFFEANGLVAFATSADGQTWAQQGPSVPDPFPLTSLYVQFNANGFGAGPHGQARYNNFNLPGAGLGPALGRLSDTPGTFAAPAPVVTATPEAGAPLPGAGQVNLPVAAPPEGERRRPSPPAGTARAEKPDGGWADPLVLDFLLSERGPASPAG